MIVKQPDLFTPGGSEELRRIGREWVDSEEKKESDREDAKRIRDTASLMNETV